MHIFHTHVHAHVHAHVYSHAHAHIHAHIHAHACPNLLVVVHPVVPDRVPSRIGAGGARVARPAPAHSNAYIREVADIAVLYQRAYSVANLKGAWACTRDEDDDGEWE